MAKRKTAAAAADKPNILLFGIDSLLSTHMSCYGYHHLTTPYMDEFAEDAVLFEETFSPHVPTTPAYTAMLTGMDPFTTGVVALRHKGGLPRKIKTLPRILKAAGYNTSCVGFTGNPASEGFAKYIDYKAWGSWEDKPARKAEHLNDVAMPEIERLNKSGKPFFLMLRHMDPHSPYLPPPPYDRMFYYGNEFDPKNKSMKPVFDFKPFADYFRTWMPPGVTDKDYIIAQYDGAVAYMDACIQQILLQLEHLGILDNTIVVINSDHGETLYDHECWFDHHGLYDVTLQVPLIIRYPKRLPSGMRVAGYNTHKDLVPTLLELAEIDPGIDFDGQSLMQLVRGEKVSFESELFISECTWMRKQGWRTPQWKLITALEPDFHFMPPVELYNMIEDPDELDNVADKHPEVVEMLTKRMNDFIARREKETGNTNPMMTQGDWTGRGRERNFQSSEEAYAAQHIGDPEAARRLQAEARKK